MHGADRDIMWLQRDFGIYVCNMFDTGQVLISHIIALLDCGDVTYKNSLMYGQQHMIFWNIAYSIPDH